MEKEVKSFLEAEKIAVELVETLRHLYNEASSYQTATEELNIVRQRLLNLIEVTESLINGIHEIVKILKEMGIHGILNRLTEIEHTIHKEVSNPLKEIENSNKLVINRLTEIENKLENKLVETFIEQSKYMNKLKTLIIATLGSSLILIIILIIMFLK